MKIFLQCILIYLVQYIVWILMEALFSISLETWYQRSRTCPTCRKACPTSIKLYFSDAQESSSQEDVHTVKVSSNPSSPGAGS